MARPPRSAANDARAASGPGMDPTRDLFADLDAQAAAPPAQAPGAPPDTAPAAATVTEPAPAVPGSPAQDGPPPASGPRIAYAEAQRLMAIGRSQGPQALTPDQHHAIWDCLRDLPESQAWLAAQLTALQGELQERGLRPRPGHPTAR